MALSYTNDGGNEEMKVDLGNLKDSKISDHANEIKNIFVHEEKHYSDYKEIGGSQMNEIRQTVEGYKVVERRAVHTQIEHPTYNKTRKGFQRAVLEYGLDNGYVPFIRRKGL